MERVPRRLRAGSEKFPTRARKRGAAVRRPADGVARVVAKVVQHLVALAAGEEARARRREAKQGQKLARVGRLQGGGNASEQGLRGGGGARASFGAHCTSWIGPSFGSLITDASPAGRVREGSEKGPSRLRQQSSRIGGKSPDASMCMRPEAPSYDLPPVSTSTCVRTSSACPSGENLSCASAACRTVPRRFRAGAEVGRGPLRRPAPALKKVLEARKRPSP